MVKPRQMKAKPGPKADFVGEKGWRFIRLWQTLMIVAEADRPLSVKEINALLPRSEETAPLQQYVGKLATTRDDLWLLVRCGFPLVLLEEQGEEVDLADYREMDSRRGRLKNTRWALRSPDDIGLLTSPHHKHPSPADLTTLALMRALLRDHVPSGFPLFGHLRRMLESFHQWQQGHHRGANREQMLERFVRTGKVYLRRGPGAETLLVVAKALHQRAAVEGLYCSPGGEPFTLQIAPQAASFEDGRGFLLAARLKDGELRNYRLDRFETLRLLTNVKLPKIDKSAVHALTASRFGGYVAKPERIELLVDSEAAYLFDEYEFHASQKTRRLKNGRLKVTLDCAISYSLEEWILGFGEHMEVKAPPTLRDAISARLNSALAKYQTR